MALGVVPLDVLELRRLDEGRVVPVEVAQPGVDGGVAGADIADVALEVLDVDRLVGVSLGFGMLVGVAGSRLTSKRMRVT